MALHVFFYQAEDGEQKGNSAASEITAVNLDFILHGRSICLWVKHMPGDKESISVGLNQSGDHSLFDNVHSAVQEINKMV